jgi:hypothetical protein
MKRIYLIKALFISSILFFISSINAQENQKEIFIIGTMHNVPKIIKNSYKPLYKKALKYQPDAIYIENVRAEDSLSMDIYYPSFIAYSDSIKLEFEYDENKFNALIKKDIKYLEKEDCRYIAKSFAIKRDYANYRYYYYFFKYGNKGSKKSLQNENGDLSYKLAMNLNMKYIFPMDDQKDYKKYGQSWKKCVQQTQNSEDSKKANKQSKRLRQRSIIPAIFGRYGIWTNRARTTKEYHHLNSFEYVTSECEPCADGNYYWDKRNHSMAENIGSQIMKNGHDRSLVVVGAGHVKGLKEALAKLYPNIVIKVLKDKPYKNVNSSAVNETLISQQ